MARLKRQANAAERYKKLKQEKRELESRLATLRWKALMADARRGQEGLARRETRREEAIARQRAAEAALEKLHQEQGQASESLNVVQGELYGVGGEIARLEQTIQHARELHERQQAEFKETEEALRDLRAEGIEPMALLSLLARLGSSDPVELKQQRNRNDQRKRTFNVLVPLTTVGTAEELTMTLPRPGVEGPKRARSISPPAAQSSRVKPMSKRADLMKAP